MLPLSDFNGFIMLLAGSTAMHNYCWTLTSWLLSCGKLLTFEVLPLLSVVYRVMLVSFTVSGDGVV